MKLVPFEPLEELSFFDLGEVLNLPDGLILDQKSLYQTFDGFILESLRIYDVGVGLDYLVVDVYGLLQFLAEREMAA